MLQLNRKNFNKNQYPTKVMQFGEGNFLRAFIDWQIDILNETTDLQAGVSVIRPIDYDTLPLLNTQDGLYTTIIRGLNENGETVSDKRIISCINEEIPVYKDFSRYLALAENPDIKLIFSNTTEAGIDYNAQDKLDDAPASTFPAKLTQWLYRRYQHFNGADSAGLVMIPCELIDYNGEKLKQIVHQYAQLWQLPAEFVTWLNHANHFCSTLVDRIVTGFPRSEHESLQQEVGYLDNFMVTAEHFHLFVIQGPKHLADLLCLHGSTLNIKIVDDISPYKQRKVAILNGAHTAVVPLAYMANIDSVGETLAQPLFEQYLNQLIYREIIPTLSLPEDELNSFARDVMNRFRNPYIYHELLSISLNSMTKYTTRIVPQLNLYLKNSQSVPPMMALAFAGQMWFYRGLRDGEVIALSDNKQWLSLFNDLWSQVAAGDITVGYLVTEVLGASWHWGQDLNQLDGFTAQVTNNLESLMANGVVATMTAALDDL
ncbi:tagaturonate reductase [Shewanella sp. UCD-KL21]|uniref:tagaturonate reductase n=1 Tax=Shewanella sp. UCD-KL21 TaxID=1917164 RepID=UPI0009703498|nr:tagaturonate reductase [Shewanella sp. UCD-KL21]